MILYDLLKNLIDNKHYEKVDMANKLNVFFTFGQITLVQYTELITKINPEVVEDNTNEGDVTNPEPETAKKEEVTA